MLECKTFLFFTIFDKENNHLIFTEMAKVVQKSTQKGLAVAVDTDTAYALRSDEILVTKDGNTRPMRKSVFALLGADKNGWKEVTAEKPAEPAKAVTSDKSKKGKKASKEEVFDSESKNIIQALKEAGIDIDSPSDERTKLILDRQANLDKDSVDFDLLTEFYAATVEALESEEEEKEDDVEKIVLTQEHLDLNPKLAEQGKKVGDSVEIESVEVKP